MMDGWGVGKWVDFRMDNGQSDRQRDGQMDWRTHIVQLLPPSVRGMDINISYMFTLETGGDGCGVGLGRISQFSDGGRTDCWA